MADSYRAVLMKQKHRHRFSDDIRASYHNAFLAGYIYPRFLYQLHYSGWCTRHKIVAACHYFPNIYRMESIDILFRIYRVYYLLLIVVLRQRQLTEYTRNSTVFVELIYERQKLRLRCIGAEQIFKRLYANILTCLLFIIYIYLTCRIVSYQYNGEPRNYPA